ncbi:MAG: hypothetical protein M1281_04730 [Chloroflexi bacterium]|nr:hypothetical protein [Chloroflexota bacterium]
MDPISYKRPPNGNDPSFSGPELAVRRVALRTILVAIQDEIEGDANTRREAHDWLKTVGLSWLELLGLHDLQAQVYRVTATSSFPGNFRTTAKMYLCREW